MRGRIEKRLFKQVEVPVLARKGPADKDAGYSADDGAGRRDLLSHQAGLLLLLRLSMDAGCNIKVLIPGRVNLQPRDYSVYCIPAIFLFLNWMRNE